MTSLNRDKTKKELLERGTSCLQKINKVEYDVTNLFYLTCLAEWTVKDFSGKDELGKTIDHHDALLLTEIGLPEPKDWLHYTIEPSNDTFPGLYEIAFAPKEGAILIMDIQAIEEPKKLNPSDVIFLGWHKACFDHGGGYRSIAGVMTIIMRGIESLETKVAMEDFWAPYEPQELDAKALETASPAQKRYQKVFKMNTDEAKTLLGSPNGSAITYLIGTHQELRKTKRIESIEMVKIAKIGGFGNSLVFNLCDI